MGVEAMLVLRERRMSPNNSSNRFSVVAVGDVMGTSDSLIGEEGGEGGGTGLAEESSCSLTEDNSSLEIAGVLLLISGQ